MAFRRWSEVAKFSLSARSRLPCHWYRRMNPMGFKIRRTATGTATAIVYFCSDFRWLSTLTSGNKPNSWHGIARNLVDDHFPVRPHAVNSDCLPPRMSAFASRIANGFWTHRTDVRRCTYIMQNQLPWFIPIDYLLLFVNWCESRRISYSVRENRSILFFFFASSPLFREMFACVCNNVNDKQFWRMVHTAVGQTF